MSFKNIIIPARAGSKGWARKNVTLFDHTAQIIPTEYKSKVIVSTNDDTISAMADSYNFMQHSRKDEHAGDRASIKSTLQDIVQQGDYRTTDIIIGLYLTYPSRTWYDVTSMYNEFVSTRATSMLCSQPVLTHPYLTMYPAANKTGTQVIQHNKYQRQQYPEIFEISHYMFMFRVGELKKLNANLYNNDTKYYPIERVIDVDSEKDYKQFIKTNETENIYN